MQHFFFSLVLVIIFSTSSFAYSGGSGIQADPYQITGLNDWQILMNTSADWNKYFVLTTDVNLAGVTMRSVGNESELESVTMIFIGGCIV